MALTDSPAVLVVDDEVRILSALRRSLRREGYEILTAETVEEALRVLDERPVALILSDHKMPGMSGVQFLAEAARRCPEAVRMLITGWTEEIPREQLEELGVCALITKPWDDEKLKATLRRALG
jgi:response regulator RpfG family c-di-GMP phosphodiesterase